MGPAPSHHASILRTPFGSPSDYEPLGILGKGAFGTAYLVRDTTAKDKNALYAQKRMKADLLAIQEIHSMIHLVHANIIRFRDFVIDKDKEEICTILELCDGGTLGQNLDQIVQGLKPVLKTKEALCLLLQIAEGINYLHSNDMIHRDIKPDNIFLSDGRVKIGDLGLAKKLQAKAAQTVAGTMPFMSPEIFSGDGYGRPADIWAVGITFICICGAMKKRPRMTSSLEDILALNTNSTTNAFGLTAMRSANDARAALDRQLRQLDVPSYCCDIIRRMLEPNPAKRITAAQLCDELSKQLRKNAERSWKFPTQDVTEQLLKRKDDALPGEVLSILRAALLARLIGAAGAGEVGMTEAMQALGIEPTGGEEQLQGVIKTVRGLLNKWGINFSYDDKKITFNMGDMDDVNEGHRTIYVFSTRRDTIRIHQLISPTFKITTEQMGTAMVFVARANYNLAIGRWYISSSGIMTYESTQSVPFGESASAIFSTMFLYSEGVWNQYTSQMIEVLKGNAAKGIMSNLDPI